MKADPEKFCFFNLHNAFFRPAQIDVYAVNRLVFKKREPF